MSNNITNIDDIKFGTSAATITINASPSAPATQMILTPSNKVYKYINIIVSHPEATHGDTEFTLSTMYQGTYYPVFICKLDPKETVHAVTRSTTLIVNPSHYLVYKATGNANVDNLNITFFREEITL